jgi:uncharacterized protein (DUF1800 family)
MAFLDKYTGPWNLQVAQHLLRRTTYGVTIKAAKAIANTSLDETINGLFSSSALPSPPLNNYYADDPNVPIGQTWVDKLQTQGVNGYRQTSLRAWTMDLMMQPVPNIREKMTVFWHNHFVVEGINDARLMYNYITLIRKNALGDFKQLTKDMTIDVAMLAYLNGDDNTNTAPNENYARELMELFTLGKGDIAGPGDYTTFTEKDVKEIAKSLTGWISIVNNLPIRAEFRTGRHDTTAKQLSHRFNNATIANNGANEYKDIIDLIFTKPEVALFIARKFYRWFVNPIIDATIETEVISPLALIIRTDNYRVERALKTLLSSQHFYDECNIGVLIKNPNDFVLSLLNQFEILPPADPLFKENVLRTVYSNTVSQQMGIFQAPNVAGWQAFYQEPNFDGLWLNSTTLPIRKVTTDAIAGPGVSVNNTNGYRLRIDHLKYLDTLDNPSDVDAVLDQTTQYIFAKPIAPNQRAVLLNLLLNGNSAATWTNWYNDYKANPTVEAKRLILINRLTPLLVYMMRMPEYHLS